MDLVSRRVPVRGRRVGQVVAARLSIRIICVDGAAALIFSEEFLNLPIVHAGANRELEIFLGDGVPVLENTMMLAKSR